MLTQNEIPETRGLMPNQDAAARYLSSRYRLNHHSICSALFGREPHEILPAQYGRLMDSIRLIGEMRNNPNTLYTVESAMEVLSRAGYAKPEFKVRLTLNGLISSGFVELFGGRYRYKADSVERSESRFNEARAILSSPTAKGDRVNGIET